MNYISINLEKYICAWDICNTRQLFQASYKLYFFSVWYFWFFLSFSMCITGYRGIYLTALTNGRNPLLSERITVAQYRGNRTLSSFGGIYLILYSNLFKTVAIQSVLGRYKYSLNSFLYLQTNQMENKYPVCFLSLKLFQDLTFQLTWDFVYFSDEEAANNISWACVSIQIKLADRFFLCEFSLNLKTSFLL